MRIRMLTYLREDKCGAHDTEASTAQTMLIETALPLLKIITLLEGATLPFFKTLCMNGKLESLRNENRIVSGSVNSSFFLNFALPGKYNTVWVYKFSRISNRTKIRRGDCSTEYFNCSYTQVNASHAEVQMSGIIRRGMSWIQFMPTNRSLLPVSIAVFPDGVWSVSDAGIFVDPKDSFFVAAKNKETLSVVCRHYKKTKNFAIRVGRLPNYAYKNINGTVQNDTDNFPEIVSLRNSTDDKFVNFTITVRRRHPVDYLSCCSDYRGTPYYATYVIDWDNHYSNESIQKGICGNSRWLLRLLTLGS